MPEISSIEKSQAYISAINGIDGSAHSDGGDSGLYVAGVLNNLCLYMRILRAK